jgi:hypothetical protein
MKGRWVELKGRWVEMKGWPAKRAKVGSGVTI